jgi:hypothetical protein
MSMGELLVNTRHQTFEQACWKCFGEPECRLGAALKRGLFTESFPYGRRPPQVSDRSLYIGKIFEI